MNRAGNSPANSPVDVSKSLEETEWASQVQAPWPVWSYTSAPEPSEPLSSSEPFKSLHFNFPLTRIKQCEKIPVSSVPLLQWGLGWVSHSTIPLIPCLPARHTAQAGLLFPQVMIYAGGPGQGRVEYQFRWVTVLNDRCMDGYCCLGSK